MNTKRENVLSLDSSFADFESEADLIEHLRKTINLLDRTMTLLARVKSGNIPSRDFDCIIAQVKDDFIHKLINRYPALTSIELKVCAFTRMNMNSKEIASHCNLSLRSIEDVRYRIRKKMSLETSTKLTEFIVSMNFDAPLPTTNP